VSAEFDLAGIFMSTAVLTALLAFVADSLLRRLLRRIGLYRHVWHPALFDAALFIILWAAISALSLRI
jgi:hypothetical protein